MIQFLQNLKNILNISSKVDDQQKEFNILLLKR